ncbi:MAG: phosphatidylserine/phosphatidylglycerophosphate/cardiolipin synthase family protein [Traorella sp.]
MDILNEETVLSHGLPGKVDAEEQNKNDILCSYFILEEGKMWNDILDVLVEKVQQGVDVRLMYDDAGCITKLKDGYDAKLRELGIKCKVFNPLRAQLIIQMNNRDHRKLTVIDNKVGFCGGINLADEYMNTKEIYGHWRDQGVMLKGSGVTSLTYMFLKFWDFGEKEKTQFENYLTLEDGEDDGFVAPFSDSPTDEEAVGYCAHLNIINSADEYIYIQTPYLILDNGMKDGLALASKNGVDVRIMVPHIPDKKLVNQVTKSNYQPLLESGVRIYEYTPGFVHAKTIISDDSMGVIGSINFDYRSYFLHFENGIWMYKSKAILDCKEDFLKTLNECHEVTYEEYMQTNVIVRVLRSVLNLFAPLL